MSGGTSRPPKDEKKKSGTAKPTSAKPASGGTSRPPKDK